MRKLRTIVLEDVDSERSWLIKKLAHFDEIEIVGEAANLDDSFQLIASVQADAAFVDIQLHGGKVFDLIKRLQEHGIAIPYCVITTGYTQYLMSALNDHRRYVVQYLLKPFGEDWKQTFRKPIDALLAAKWGPATSIDSFQVPQFIFINDRGNLLRLDFDKIAYLEAAGGGETYVVTDTETHQVDMTLAKFLELLPAERFFRISKSNIANLGRIMRINREDRIIGIQQGTKEKSLGVGDGYYADLLRHLPTAKGFAAKIVAAKKLIKEAATSDKKEDHFQNAGGENSELSFEKQSSPSLTTPIPSGKVVQHPTPIGQMAAKKVDLATIISCTFYGSAPVFEEMSPDDFIEDIKFCSRAFDEILERRDLKRIKSFGICYMCIGGLAESDNDYTIRVVQAALEMRQFLQKTKASQKARNCSWVEACIGIHTGPIIATASEESNATYEVWGNTVQIATRIEQTGKPGQINLSVNTYEHIKRHFACLYAGIIDTLEQKEMEIYSI